MYRKRGKERNNVVENWSLENEGGLKEQRLEEMSHMEQRIRF
jgi:hypothetical protein